MGKLALILLHLCLPALLVSCKGQNKMIRVPMDMSELKVMHAWMQHRAIGLGLKNRRQVASRHETQWPSLGSGIGCSVSHWEQFISVAMHVFTCGRQEEAMQQYASGCVVLYADFLQACKGSGCSTCMRESAEHLQHALGMPSGALHQAVSIL